MGKFLDQDKEAYKITASIVYSASRSEEIQSTFPLGAEEAQGEDASDYHV